MSFRLKLNQHRYERQGERKRERGRERGGGRGGGGYTQQSLLPNVNYVQCISR